jgi:hypothetical protein
MKTPRTLFARSVSAWLLLVGSVAIPTPVGAGNEPWQAHEDSTAYRNECSACHIAFPPALLAADDWLAIMSELDKHYGANASLDEKTRKEIAAFLERNASTDRSRASREDTPRITSTDWFAKKHQGAFRLVLKGRVKSLVDCAACHKGPDIEKMTGG